MVFPKGAQQNGLQGHQKVSLSQINFLNHKSNAMRLLSLIHSELKSLLVESPTTEHSSNLCLR